MKKQELLSNLNDSGVTSSNLKSKANSIQKRAVQKHGFEKVKKWMEEKEKKEDQKILMEHQKKMAKSFNISFKKWKTLHEKAQTILGSFDTGHSMGCFRSLYLSYFDIKKRKVFARNNNATSYANSCKWKPVHGSICIVLKKSELEQIENIEGVWTIVYPDGSAKWLTSKGIKQNYSVIWENGFCVGTSHSKTLDGAKFLEKRKEVLRIQAQENEKMFIGANHVKAVGACWDGIKSFCERNGLNPEFGYNIGYLKSLNDPYANRYLQSIKRS